MKKGLLILLLVSSSLGLAQTGVIKGIVYSEAGNEPLPFAKVLLLPDSLSTATDVDGKYEFSGLTPANYSIQVRYAGFQPGVVTDIPVKLSSEQVVDIQLKPVSEELEEVVVRVSPFREVEEAPVSLRSLNATEIERFPGANRDVSKVVQSLPGFSPQPTFRNDIVIRGGAPNENRFFLDGIEVPNINHFATQGGSGGPVGLLNINLIRNVEFYSGAFPSSRGNALSSVIEFEQKNPSQVGFTSTFTLGSSDAGITFDTPLGDKTGLIFSARRSYLQLLFSALKLPFLPTYNDAQFKVRHQPNQKTEILFIGLGALDNFTLNTSVNDGVEDVETIERNNYLLGNIPDNDQWNYTLGTVVKRFHDKGFHRFVLSRNRLTNLAKKYEDNVEDPANLILDYESSEIENKFRYENTLRDGKWKLLYGAGLEYAQYLNSTYNRIYTPAGPETVDFDSEIDLFKYSAFGQASYSLPRVTLSLGLRADASSFGDKLMNILEQLSPRLSVSYKINERLSANANVGRYVQLPSYTILGHRDTRGNLVNKDRIEYIKSDHLVAGLKYDLENYGQVSIEGFYKRYTDYPFSLRDSISLANLGADFGVVGNEPVNSSSVGRSYGVEFLYQQKLYKGFYGILTYTLVRSEFKNRGEYVPSAWDNRHVVSITGGKKFKSNWDVGVRWLYSGGAPYTPYDLELSSLKPSWDVRGKGILDYSRLNSQRLKPFHQLDFRVDKRWFYEKWTLNLYLDIQNVYGYAPDTPSYLALETDNQGQPISNPNDPNRYVLKSISSASGTSIPTLGVVLEF